MSINFDHSLCSDLEFARSHEWLVTNGIGGYASGTISGILTRRYHGVLMAALNPPLGRTLLVPKYDEMAFYNDKPYPLFTNQWDAKTCEPDGYTRIERFYLDGLIPVWEYRVGEALLEKRTWMRQGENTTYTLYTFLHGESPLKLQVKAFVNYRDYHGTTQEDWQMDIQSVENGIRVNPAPDATEFVILSDRAELTPRHIWMQNFYRAAEVYRGFPELEKHLLAADFSVTLNSGDTLTLVASTEARPDLDGPAQLKARQDYENQLAAGYEDPTTQMLVQAADTFIVKRPTPDNPEGRSVLAGYHWFSDWGRDTMIALPGLTLSTGRYDIARQILEVFAQFVFRGMIPNRFPDAGEEPEYNTVDATLWYFHAVGDYYTATQDKDLLSKLYSVLETIIEWHQKGTRFNIKCDPDDGLLYAGQEGVQLTWMDAKVADWVVTPRIGKPVEVNALWYNALRNMESFAEILGKDSRSYRNLAETTQRGFARFWNEETGYCYDVLDGPDGHDPVLRPNQIFAVSLPHPLLDETQQKAVVDICAAHLLTLHGLRSLAASEADYIGIYGGDIMARDGAYHQGTVWSWLIGPFVTAYLRVYQNTEKARDYLLPLIKQTASHGVGSISEIYDGDAPFTPRGCIAQAWSIAEVLRVWMLTQKG